MGLLIQFNSDLWLSAGIVGLPVVVLAIGLRLSKSLTFGEAG